MKHFHKSKMSIISNDFVWGQGLPIAASVFFPYALSCSKVFSNDDSIIFTFQFSQICSINTTIGNMRGSVEGGGGCSVKISLKK